MWRALHKIADLLLQVVKAANPFEFLVELISVLFNYDYSQNSDVRTTDTEYEHSYSCMNPQIIKSAIAMNPFLKIQNRSTGHWISIPSFQKSERYSYATSYLNHSLSTSKLFIIVSTEDAIESAVHENTSTAYSLIATRTVEFEYIRISTLRYRKPWLPFRVRERKRKERR